MRSGTALGGDNRATSFRAWPQLVSSCVTALQMISRWVVAVDLSARDQTEVECTESNPVSGSRLAASGVWIVLTSSFVPRIPGCDMIYSDVWTPGRDRRNPHRDHVH